MKLSWRRSDAEQPREHKPRGQALVEMAIILPVLVLLVLLAVDFGRVFFGWVALHNAARVAANDAAVRPNAWEPPGDSDGQDLYRVEVLNELLPINCAPPAAADANGNGQWDADEIPDPLFINKPTTSFSADQYEPGDHAQVTLECGFSFITPLVGGIVGDPMPITASAEFPVRGGEIMGIPVEGEPPPLPPCTGAFVPQMVGMSVETARTTWYSRGFDPGTFDPDTGSETEIVSAQTTSPSSSAGDCMPVSTTVVVTHGEAAPCADEDDIQVPALIGLTVSNARTEWTGVGFTGSFSPSTGSDTDVVTGQSIVQGACRPPETSISVTHEPPPEDPPPTCTAPQLIGLRVNDGQSAWTTAGFTGSYIISRPPQGNYVVTNQSLVGGQLYLCNSTITVGGSG